MRFAHFFVDRPIFATVVSIILVLVGVIAYLQLPIVQYPEIAPPTVVVRASYPGADADTVAATVATPLEQEVNGVEGMLYMSSYSTSDGSMSLTITFALGTDLDLAQVLVQNRVAIALPRLPEEAQRLGVTTAKSSPDLMMVVHMLSPDGTYDQLYVSNYARSQVRDLLVRLPGVGDLQLFGERQFAMRVWIDPDKLASYDLSAADVVAALREENVQVSGGSIGAPPQPTDTAFQYIVTTQGRFSDAREFREIVVKRGDQGRVVRLRDVARVELGAQDYLRNSYLNGKEAVALGIFQRPGSNALDTAAQIKATMDELAKDFPPGLTYDIVYNPTEFISSSIDEVYKTLGEAILLVVVVIIVFLQSWRTALIPIIAIPVSLIGTFAIMAGFGFSLNMLTLFGLVLAIGIVVDDAIVVVENVERNIASGLSPREAAHRTMDEVGTAIIGISLVLAAVFVPTAFIPGISGQFYQQFALTIAASTLISAVNSLTLSPALAALLLRPHHAAKSKFFLARFGRWAGGGFNRGFDATSHGYSRSVNFVAGGKVRRLLALAVFAGLLYVTVDLFQKVPTGFIPELDQGYSISVIQLPDGASLQRTDQVVRAATQIINDTPGVKNAVGFAGFNGATFTNASNAGVIFAAFDDFDDRLKAGGEDATSIIQNLNMRLASIKEAFIITVPPPSVRGIGNSGGFKLQLQEREGSSINRVLGAAYQMMFAAAKDPRLTGVFTTFSASSPQLYLNIDRVKARMLNVPVSAIFDTLSINLGTAYANDFNAFGRVYQVRVQADQQYRLTEADILRLKVRSADGNLVPLGTLAEVQERSGPDLVQRYNLYTSVPVQGNAAPGVSSGTALLAMEELASQLPPGISFEWTELAYQEKQTADTAVWIFALSVVFVFLVLAALYESWVLPLAIILIVPLAVGAALFGVSLRGMDNNILTQIGFVVLVGLAAKNAILIVEFAKQAEEQGKSILDAAVEASRLRLRPILMTAFAFILGVVPLVIAEGPAAEMRQALGTAVFYGMLGVTFFGLFLTPTFYVVLRSLVARRPKAAAPVEQPDPARGN